MALLLHLRLRSRTKGNPSLILFFSTSNSNSNSPFSSLFRDIRDSLKQPSPPLPPSNPRSHRAPQKPSIDEIRKNLTEFRARTAAPPPADPPHQQYSFQEQYHRNMQQQNPPKSINLEAFRESLLNVKANAQTSPLRPRPSLIGGTGPLPESVFGKEMRKGGSATTAFLKTYGVEDLGKKLRMLRPEGKGKDWFSIGELSERLVRLRKMEEEQTHSHTRDGAMLNLYSMN
ncbi:hypothetical protein E2542_SST25931 [Spatholobus suberectus]|nr:hypothetical protein E2542_SST25931 [Spatholobus suberectus]